MQQKQMQLQKYALMKKKTNFKLQDKDKYLQKVTWSVTSNKPG